MIVLADQLQRDSQPGHVCERRVPHEQVSVVINRANTPHCRFPVYTHELIQPPTRFLDTRLKTVSLRRVVVGSFGAWHVAEDDDPSEAPRSSGVKDVEPPTPPDMPGAAAEIVQDGVWGGV